MPARKLILGIDALPQQAIEGLNRMPWFWRRVIVCAIVFWSMGLLTYLAVMGSDSTQADIGFYVAGVLVSTMASYLGIATVDHQNERKANLAAAAILPQASTESADTTQTNIDVKVDT